MSPSLKQIQRFFRRLTRKRGMKPVNHAYTVCQICGREVAVTKNGRTFLHRCEPKVTHE